MNQHVDAETDSSAATAPQLSETERATRALIRLCAQEVIQRLKEPTDRPDVSAGEVGAGDLGS